MNRLVPALATALAAFTACADVDPASLITRDRVLGARVTVDADPARAWPAPGEAATVTWLTASPGAPPTFAWVLAACPAATSAGLPACEGPPFAVSQAAGAVPALRFTVPAEMTASAIVVTGAICASGAPVIGDGAAAATCDDGSRPDVVSQHVFVARDGAVNHHPQLAQAPIALDGAPWAAGVAPGCGAGAPALAIDGDRARIAITFTAGDRESYPTSEQAAPAREELQLSTFATAGEIVQAHAYVEAEDARAQSPVVVEWDLPAADERPAGGRVGFHFVVRDLRGGVDMASRELCLP